MSCKAAVINTDVNFSNNNWMRKVGKTYKVSEEHGSCKVRLRGKLESSTNNIDIMEGEKQYSN